MEIVVSEGEGFGWGSGKANYSAKRDFTSQGKIKHLNSNNLIPAFEKWHFENVSCVS